MRQFWFKNLLVCIVFASGMFMTSCKNKQKDTSANSADTISYTAPVEISADDALQKGVQDATKDYPGVTATVSNGEINLSGTLERSKLQNLMMSLNTLQPKKINNNLTLK